MRRYRPKTLDLVLIALALTLGAMAGLVGRHAGTRGAPPTRSSGRQAPPPAADVAPGEVARPPERADGRARSIAGGPAAAPPPAPHRSPYDRALDALDAPAGSSPYDRALAGLEAPRAQVDAPPEEVAAAELAAHPGRYLGRPVRVAVQFHSWVAAWNPYLTRFGAADWRCFRAWGDDQRLWNEREFDAPSMRLFARKGGAAAWALNGAGPRARFELELVVHAVLAGRPWAEVRAVEPLAPTLTEGALIHASRGRHLMDEEAWGRAENELARALEGPMPEGARADLEVLLERCREARAAEEAEKPPILVPLEED